MSHSYISKGVRIRASWVDAAMVSLAGLQPKVEVRRISVTGEVRHIRSDHPVIPMNATFFLDVEVGENHEDNLQHCQKCGRDHVEVKAIHVVEVLSTASPAAPAVPEGGGDGDGVR